MQIVSSPLLLLMNIFLAFLYIYLSNLILKSFGHIPNEDTLKSNFELFYILE